MLFKDMGFKFDAHPSYDTSICNAYDAILMRVNVNASTGSSF